LRLVGSKGFIAITLAIAFAFIPYHWGRGLGHLYLALTYSVVTGMILVLLIGTGRFTRMIEGKKKLQLAGVAALILITAWSGLYYAVFAIILMCAAVLWRFAKKDNLKQLIHNLIPIAITAAFVVIGFLPGIIATRNSPAFAVLAERTPYESVMFAGILIAALVPAPILPSALFSFYNTAITDAVNAAPAFENRVPTNFGTIVTFAAFILLVLGLFARARYTKWTKSTKDLPLISYLLLVSTLFFIPWGLNYVFAATLTAQVRAWNRFLPILLLLIILGAAIVLKRVKRKQSIALIATAGIAATFVNAVAPFKNPYVTSSTNVTMTANAARDYTKEINTKIPQDCAVLQLPYMSYPENGPLLDLDDYGHFWLPVNDIGKSWSYGAIKNTEAGYWSSKLPEIPTPVQVQALTEAGFCGIHLDSRGYVVPAAERIKAELQTRYGPPITAGNPDAADTDTWFFYQLPNFQPIADLNTLTPNTQSLFLAPAITTETPNVPGFSVAPRGSKDGLIWWWTIAPTATFTIHQINDRFPITSITIGLRSSECENAQVTATLTNANGERLSVPLTLDINSKTTTDITLVTEPISSATLTLESSGQGCMVEDFPYPQFVQVISPTTD